VATRAGAIFLGLQAMFDQLSRRALPAYWAADGVHPSVAGHGAIAQLWLETVRV
jgi:lysophospholipase L1-like esterase